MEEDKKMNKIEKLEKEIKECDISLKEGIQKKIDLIGKLIPMVSLSSKIFYAQLQKQLWISLNKYEENT